MKRWPQLLLCIAVIAIAGCSQTGLSTTVSTNSCKPSAKEPFTATINIDETGVLSERCVFDEELSNKLLPLSTAVKWQTSSKEYPLITRAIYNQASQVILYQQDQLTSWAVAMDVDETILDNSGYQVWLDTTGNKFTEQSWDTWVKSGKASLIPGVELFIEKVLSKGGKLVLITNRKAQLDAYTWENMQALALPIDENNTCLLGKSDADEKSVIKDAYTNDKDLRREQFAKGSPSCFSPTGQALSKWQTPHNILMHIGDNIEDIGSVQQETADPQILIKRYGKDIFILPNSMYGSWQ